MSNITTIQETPNLKSSTIVFTSGSTTPITAPASKVFSIITDHAHYAQWNTWTPSLTTEDDQPLHLHRKGTLTARMQKQGREYQIPIEITELENGPERYVLAWRASLMPSWFAVAERVHVVTKVSEGECEVRQWESTAGWGAYVLLWILGVRGELDEANLRYVGELREFAEREE